MQRLRALKDSLQQAQEELRKQLQVVAQERGVKIPSLERLQEEACLFE